MGIKDDFNKRTADAGDDVDADVVAAVSDASRAATKRAKTQATIQLWGSRWTQLTRRLLFVWDVVEEEDEKSRSLPKSFRFSLLTVLKSARARVVLKPLPLDAARYDYLLVSV